MRPASRDEGTEQAAVRLAQAVGDGAGLMPIGIAKGLRADSVEPGDLVLAEGQLGRSQVVCELLSSARSDNYRGYGRLGDEVGEGDLGRRHAVGGADLDEYLDRVVELALVVDRRLVPLPAQVAAALGA